jgi:hypothetical protein
MPRCSAVLFGLAITALTLVAPPALRAADSSYSSIAEKDCRRLHVLRIEGSEYAVSRVCTGRGGYKVFVDEEDLRETLTVGRSMRQAGKEPTATDHFGAFNGYEDKVEWRSGADGKPYALIVGWSFANNNDLETSGRPKSVRMLVVLRLPPGPVCKVALIDRAANSDANALARKAADEIARGFKCGVDTVPMIGKSGPASRVFVDGPEPEPQPDKP